MVNGIQIFHGVLIKYFLLRPIQGVYTYYKNECTCISVRYDANISAQVKDLSYLTELIE